MSIEGVVLAAGPSRRFAASAAPGRTRLKQLLDFGGETLVRRIVREALRSSLARVIVVTGCEAGRIRAELSDLAIALVDNSDWEAGQSTSVRAGLTAVGTDADGALFVPCDQPFLDAVTLDRLIDARLRRGTPISRPAFRGRAGAPTLFGRELFDRLATITGDEGGRQIFAAHRDSVIEIELDEPWPLADIDTWADYERLRARIEP